MRRHSSMSRDATISSSSSTQAGEFSRRAAMSANPGTVGISGVPSPWQ